MEPKFQPQLIEEKLYRFWEENKLFEANVNSEKPPFSIILPPPNANADLHMGHAMYVYEDIMIRFHKLISDEVLWLPGADHAGFETQFVFEKHLIKEGKSRFDYNRETLFKMIWEFVQNNKLNMENQLKRLGFALDWKKKKFTLDPDITKIVYETFKKLYDQDLVYRDERLVNYCTFCGTSFSDLEVIYKEKDSRLFYIKYPLQQTQGRSGYITVATTRPETMLGDTAVAVNPKDKRYKDLIGTKAIVPIVNREIPIIVDEVVDPKFGTGAVKITPAHDETDWTIGKNHKLPFIRIIDFDGKMINVPEEFKGLYPTKAREAVINKLKELQLLEKEKDYKHRVGHCYKCNRVIEPLPKEQWFIKIKPLAKKAIPLINKGEIKILPTRFKKVLLQWLENFHDWNISRQVVWGMRIPAYKCKLKVKSEKSKVEKRWFVSVEKPEKCQICGECEFEQDEDTFDTWFSSAQWPFATLRVNPDKKLFDRFYPTSVMETGYDILPWWVARMIMIGYFATDRVPFKTVFLHGLIRDKNGQKMSKSKGNVINPMMMIEKYGADALRSALIFGTKEGNDISFTEEKVIGMRNFINKVWNIGRFLEMNLQVKSPLQGKQKLKVKSTSEKLKVIQALEKEFNKEKKDYLKFMKSYQFSKALGLIYEFLWHRYADFYIEQLKDGVINGNIKALETLENVYFENLKMLHPFTPFVTEAIFQVFHKDQSILNSKL